MNPEDALKTIGPIRSQKTGLILPREGTFVGAIENLGRTLFLVYFRTAGDEYLFPNEVLWQSKYFRSMAPVNEKTNAQANLDRGRRFLDELKTHTVILDKSHAAQSVSE